MACFGQANCKFDRFGIGAEELHPRQRFLWLGLRLRSWFLVPWLLACRREGHRKALIIVQGPPSAHHFPQIPNKSLSQQFPPSV